MIFSVPGHIEMIRRGVHYVLLRPHHPMLVIKTQTRRLNRGVYKIGREYVVQLKRGVKAETDIKIVMNHIWKEERMDTSISAHNIKISVHDARVEGGYLPAEYELEFRKAYPKWDGQERWAFAFQTIEVHR